MLPMVADMSSATASPAEVTRAVNASAIRDFRIARNHTLVSLAALVGCDDGYLSKVERGLQTPSPLMVERLALALRVEVDSIAPKAVR